ncbi:neutral/alkaline non-lysosomal ceramidase N-terminal domain-containing protein [Cyclobacterium marinum]|uniref:neutral/alkaline non-lysosomal ceramidase N-terminal domain-containing protein n=1 Tax=Cyclobacterium marinum TaxID=104 RepID=UPI0011EC347B|nr:neutral/alkaline non-lysosomal ceramidase N-terminal domain-containing protein [Cyclobacterium marinum]MBI0398953.1 neutral/alkaline non-lysosomal ceramidase N-terminal domain-containing protein [Cyclobacterium marinum]
MKRLIVKPLMLFILAVAGFQLNGFGATPKDLRIALAQVDIISSAGDFKAAVVKENITPKVPKQLLGYGARLSEGILDSIYHQILILDDGDSKFALVSTDICVLSPATYDEVAKLVEKKFGIARSNFWWSVTHTHSAPEVGAPGLPEAFMGERYQHPIDTNYTDLVIDKLLDGIEKGIQQLAPASLGVGWGHSSANINRRARDIDDVAFLGMNPDGAVDRRIGILKIVHKEDHRLMATVANYAIHGTVLGGQNLLISGDGPGVVAKYVEEKSGAPMLFINGAAGNLAPIYSVYPDARSGRMNMLRRLLGDKIIMASKEILNYEDQVSFSASEMDFLTPMKEGLKWPEALNEYIVDEKGTAKIIKVPVRFLNINDKIGIWASPLELFCEISNEVRERSPFPYTFYYGYTNGWLGYMLTEEEWEYKGYEPTVSPFVPNAATRFGETVLSYLESEMKSK